MEEIKDNARVCTMLAVMFDVENIIIFLVCVCDNLRCICVICQEGVE